MYQFDLESSCPASRYNSCFQSNFPPHPVVLHLSIKQVSARREGFDRCYCAHCHLYPSRLHPRNIRRLKIDCRAPRHPKIDHGPEGNDRPRRHVASGAGGEDCQVRRCLCGGSLSYVDVHPKRGLLSHLFMWQ